MGFFKNIFKRKKGGTRVGNLLRGVSSAATGGVLGQGHGLARWEAEQSAKEQAAAQKAAEIKQGKMIAQAVAQATSRTATTTSQPVQRLEQPKPTWQENLKKYWIHISAGVLLLYIAYNNTQKPKRRRR